MTPKKKEPDNKLPTYKLCPVGHKNSPNAKNCWVCGRSMDAPAPPKPEIKPAVNIPVSAGPARKFLDVNIVAPGECERYVGKRERCDEKDPSGHICIFLPNCVTRLNRFKAKSTIEQ